MSINSVKYHTNLAQYFESKYLYLDEPDQKNPNTRKLVELPWQQTKGEMWNEVSITLCDLHFLEAKIRKELLYSLQIDYNEALNSLPEELEYRKKEKERYNTLNKYTEDLISYSRAWSEYRLKKVINNTIFLKKPCLELPKLESISPWSNTDIDLDNERVVRHPSTYDKIRLFNIFVVSESHNFLKYHNQKNFCLQQSYNYSDIGPVNEAASEIIKSPSFKENLFLLKKYSRPPFNAHPGLIRTINAHTDRISSVCITFDGSLAVSGSDDKLVKVWDLKHGQCIYILDGHTDSVNSIALTPDGKIALSGSHDKTLRIWDIVQGKCKKTIEGHNSGIKTVCISPDGRLGMSGSTDGTIKVWDLTSGACLKTLRGHKDAIYSVKMTPDFKTAISGSGAMDTTIKVWDLENGECVHTFNNQGWATNTVDITLDGTQAITGSFGKTLWLWDLRMGNSNPSNNFRHNSSINGANITPDGMIAISVSGDYENTDNTLKVWSIMNGECIRTFEGHISEQSTAVSIMPDGRKAVSGGADGKLKIWDIERGKQFLTNPEHGPIISLANSIHNELVISAADNIIKVWDALKGTYLSVLGSHINKVTVVCMTPDGKRAISGSWYDTLWEDSCWYDPDGSNEKIIIWDIGSGKFIKKLGGHKKSIVSMAISPDGRYAASISTDRSLIIWDIEMGVPSRTIECNIPYSKVYISADSKLVLIKNGNQSLDAWDIKTGLFLGNIEREINPSNVFKYLDYTSYSIGDLILTSKNELVKLSAYEYESTFILKMEKINSESCISMFPADSKINEIRIHPIFGITIATGCKILFFEHFNFNISTKNIFCTPHRLWLLAENNQSGTWDTNFTIDCPACSIRFLVDNESIDLIKTINGNYHIGIDDSPCLNLPEEAWNEPKLYTKCPKCGEKLKLNPFLVDNKDRCGQ